MDRGFHERAFLGVKNANLYPPELEERDIDCSYDYFQGDGGEKLRLLDKWVRTISMALLD